MTTCEAIQHGTGKFNLNTAHRTCFQLVLQMTLQSLESSKQQMRFPGSIKAREMP